jgi:hypothetical protein
MSDLFRRTAWAMALASTLFIAACDDDDDNGTNNPSPVTSPSPTQSASPSPSPTPTTDNNNNQNQGNQVVSFLGIARQVDEASGTLRVGGRRVDVDENTQIQNMGGQTMSLSQLQGQTVRVRGRSFDDGSVLAERITLQDQNNDGDDNNNNS